MGNARPKGTIYMAAQRGKQGQKLSIVSSSSAASSPSRRGSAQSWQLKNKGSKRAKSGKKANKKYQQHQQPQPPGDPKAHDQNQNGWKPTKNTPAQQEVNAPLAPQVEVPMPKTLEPPGEEPKIVLVPDQSRMGQKHDRRAIPQSPTEVNKMRGAVAEARKGYLRGAAAQKHALKLGYDEQLEGTPLADDELGPPMGKDSAKRTRNPAGGGGMVRSRIR